VKILIACEFSGRVRDEFAKLGHFVVSCDFRDSETPGNHYKGNVLDILDMGWDMLIAHPHCTYNTLAGIRWMYHPEDTRLPAEQRRRHPDYPNRMNDFLDGIEFFKKLQNAKIDKICIENSQPHGLCMKHVGRYTQIVQPWMFGDPYTKGAALWLKGLPKLVPTQKKSDYEKITAACHAESPGPEREKNRSRTYPSIACAMASQWGNL
jgi:hypothetical protein